MKIFLFHQIPEFKHIRFYMSDESKFSVFVLNLLLNGLKYYNFLSFYFYFYFRYNFNILFTSSFTSTIGHFLSFFVVFYSISAFLLCSSQTLFSCFTPQLYVNVWPLLLHGSSTIYWCLIEIYVLLFPLQISDT